MSSWKLTDGTVIRLGGRVEGGGELADALRETVHRVRTGYAPLVAVGPLPGGWVKLDLNDMAIVDAWVRAVARRARHEVSEAPPLEQPEAVVEDDEGLSEDGRQRIY